MTRSYAIITHHERDHTSLTGKWNWALRLFKSFLFNLIVRDPCTSPPTLSFFVQTLFDDKNNDERLRGKYNYKNVKRWGRKVPGKDIFNLKYIICPVNEGNVHWVSAVIFMEEKKIQWFDSMGGTDMYRLNGLLRYLKDEWNAKKKGQGEFNEDEWELVRCTADTPRQANGYDCGVFTCMICDFISKDQPLLFNQNHINQCRDRIALSIMKNCAIE